MTCAVITLAGCASVNRPPFGLHPNYTSALVADPTPGYETVLRVAADGSAQYSTIQDAIMASKAFPWRPVRIEVADGIYNEKINVFSWNTKLSIIGESRERTIIQFSDHFEGLALGRNSTFHTFTMKVSGNDFHADNLTIVNAAGPVGQAVALHVEADRASFSNVSIKGYQDTLYLAGEGRRSFFENCYIEGSVDFIFGEGTALFENCEIRSLLDGYITAASTPAREPYGFVFKGARLTSAPEADEVYLGRPWRHFAKTIFLDCEMGDHILPVGWDDWSDPDKRSTVFSAEYGSTGLGGKLDQRADWSVLLSPRRARSYDRKSILRGWDPAK